MRKTLTTEQITGIYNLLSTSKSNTLDDADRIKLINIRKVCKPVAAAYNDFNKDAIETLKFDGFDEVVTKLQAGAVNGEEFVEACLKMGKYNKTLKEARTPELAKAHEVEIETISLSAFLKLSKENDWANDAEDVLAEVIV